MPRVGAQPPKGNPALCHVKTCSGKMGKAFLCIPSFVANAAQCQPWPFNGQFWNSVGYLYDFQVLPPQKRLASTFQPTMKLLIDHPFAFLDGGPGLSMGHFIHSVWLLVWFPSAATIKWLALTFQPSMKLVIEPAPAILLGWNCVESWVFNPITNVKLGWKSSHYIIKWLASTHQPNLTLVIGLNTQLSRQFQPKRMAGAGSITNFMVGWKVEASHFIVAALGNHTSSPYCSKMAHWKARACIWRHWKQNQGTQKDGRCWLKSPISWWVDRLRPTFLYVFVVAALGNHTSSPRYSKIAHWKARVGTGRHWKQNEGMATCFDSQWGAEICWLVPWPFRMGTSHFIDIFWYNFQVFWGQAPSKYSVLIWVGATYFQAVPSHFIVETCGNHFITLKRLARPPRCMFIGVFFFSNFRVFRFSVPVCTFLIFALSDFRR